MALINPPENKVAKRTSEHFLINLILGFFTEEEPSKKQYFFCFVSELKSMHGDYLIRKQCFKILTQQKRLMGEDFLRQQPDPNGAL